MFHINPTNLELGVLNTSVAVIRGVNIPHEEHPDVAEYRKSALEKALSYSTNDLEQSSVLEGYREIYRKLGYPENKIKPAAQSFIELLWRRKKIPKN